MASQDLLPVSLKDRMNASVGVYDQWRRDEGARIAKPLAADAVYNQQKALFVAKPDESLLRMTIQKYIEERQNSYLKVALNQPGWDPVLGALDEAKSIYEAKASRNWLRKPFRSPVAIENVKTLLECLPTEKGLALIKIGLFLVFNAIKRRSEACEAVYKCFASIPDILRESEEILEAARGDDTLVSAFNDLMNQLTVSLPMLIDYLLQTEQGNVFKKTIKAVLGDPAAMVTREMEAIRVLAERLKRHADHLERKRRQDDRRIAKSTQAEVSYIRKNQTDATMSLRELKEAGEKRDKALLDQMRDMMTTFNQRQAHEHDIAVAALQFRDDVARVSIMLTGLHMLMAKCERRSMLQAANAKPLLAGPRYSSQDMLEAVCAQDDPFTYQADLSNVIRQYSKTSESDIAQAAFMVTTPRFRHWHLSDSSDLLLVEAHCADYSIGRLSPMSMFCAMFVSSRLQAAQASQGVSPENNLLLWAFCSERMDLDGSFAGPAGLVRSLIVQLIVSWPRTAPQPHVDVLERIPNLWLDVRQHNVSALCQLFHELLLQLPPTCRVVCIIDGVLCYETEAWGWETELLMLTQCLRDCVYDMQRARHRAILKVLLTSPDKSISVVHCIEEDHQLDLRAGDYHSGIQDFDSMMIAGRGPAF